MTPRSLPVMRIVLRHSSIAVGRGGGHDGEPLPSWDRRHADGVRDGLEFLDGCVHAQLSYFHRQILVLRVAHAQLTVDTPPPGVQPARRGHCKGVPPPTRDEPHSVGHLDCGGEVDVLVVAQTQLTKLIPPPAVQRAAVVARQRVPPAAGQQRHPPALQALHLLRRGLIDVVTVSELPVLGPAPRVHRPCIVYDHRVPPPARDGLNLHPVQPLDPHRLVPVDRVTVADVSVPTPAPRIHLSVPRATRAVLGAACHPHHELATNHSDLLRLVAVVRARVAQLPVLVPTKRHQAPPFQNHQGVRVPARDRADLSPRQAGDRGRHEHVRGIRVTQPPKVPPAPRIHLASLRRDGDRILGAAVDV
mmetsp:Transcript_11440/g.31996  ORF Transcript_11440/g.31996 Transcript_11440/m.31996 type:complete len:361 (+) Transcript_11440:117-1199(+)